jgi:hypothetical protein
VIEHSTLLKLARDYAARKASEQPSLKAIVLTGSVARGEPPLGDAVDLDILLIGDYPPEPPHEIVRLSDYVFVDATHIPTSDYADRKAIRTHHFTGSALNDALILYDPRHYFDILQAAIRAPYNRADHIYARARSAYNAAMQVFDRLSLYREDPPPDPLSFDLLHDLRQTLYLAANTLLPLVSQTQSQSAGARKLMVRFEAAARESNPNLYSQFLESLGVHDVDSNAVEGLLHDWVALYKAASQRGSDDRLIHPFKRGYYDRGFRALIAEGHAINILWLLEETLSACARRLDPLPEAWLNFCCLTHKSNGAEFSERVRATESFLSEIDQTLNHWADQESVER